MPSAAIQVEGIRDLGRLLGQAGGPELKAELKAVHKAVAEDVAQRARQRAPVGRDRKGHTAGTLKASVRAGATVKSATVKIGGKRVPYAGPIHWGWPRRHITPQPFLTDALEAERADIVERYSADLAEFLARVFGTAAVE